MGRTLRLDAAPLRLAGRPDRSRVRGNPQVDRPFRQSEHEIFAGVRGTRRYGGRSTHHLDTAADRQPQAWFQFRQHFAATLPAASGAAATTPTVWLRTGAPHALPEPLLPWVVVLWLFGAMAFWLRLLGGWICAVRLGSRMVRPAPTEWQQALDRLKTRIRVSRPVRLLVSSLVQAPAVVGWLRPIVLVPVGALAGLPAAQIEALLVHELAHIRRHDYLVNVLQSVAEALLFYHPAVWWVSGHIRTEREQCCDDVAVSVSGDALTYVRALAELESSRPTHFRAAMAATGGSLAQRIARLLGQTRPASPTLSGPGIIAAAVLLGITGFAVFGQTAARPKFEVASIKPSAEQRFMMVRPLPGRLTASAPLRLLMQNAYTVQSFQIVGGPGWIDSERYALEAKADGNASRSEIFLMLQSLLEDRFQLKIHRETRELPVYTLVPARSGLKLPSPKEGSCVESATDTIPEPSRGRMQPAGQGRAIAGAVRQRRRDGGPTCRADAGRKGTDAGVHPDARDGAGPSGDRQDRVQRPL